MPEFGPGDCTQLAAGWLAAGFLVRDPLRLALVTLAVAAIPTGVVYGARRFGWRWAARALSALSILFVLGALTALDLSCMTAANSAAQGEADGAIRLNALVLGAFMVVGLGILFGQTLAWILPARARPPSG